MQQRIVAGMLYWRTVRKTLNQVKEQYPDFSYIEGPGILDKTFILIGEEELLATVIETFRSLQK
jgi:hypothetical protein